MTIDPLSEALARGAIKSFVVGLSAASKNVVAGISQLVGSYFIEGIERRRTIASETKKDLANDGKIRRARKTQDAAEELRLQELMEAQKRKFLQAYLDSEIDVELALAREKRELLMNARKQGNLHAAFGMAIGFIEDSPHRDRTPVLDETFLYEWIEAVERISNEDLRIIWAKLLAHQATADGDRLSPNAVDLVRRLGPQLVKIFEKLGPVAWLMQGVEGDAVPYAWATAAQFEELVEIGLFKEQEAAKLRFGHFTLSFSQLDEAKRRTNFYVLTQAGKQIFRFLSPSGERIFVDEPRAGRPESDRRKVDFHRQFVTTRSFFDTDDEAIQLIARSTQNLVESRRMSFGLTGRSISGKLIDLMSFTYSREPALREWDIIHHGADDVAEAHFADVLIKSLVGVAEKSRNVL